MYPNKPIVFLHFHKCAGSSFINNAIESGYYLPKNHINGNIVNNDEEIRKFKNKDHFNENYKLFFSKPRQLVSFEWEIPLEYLSEITDEIIIVSILRDPIKRAYSNFIYDLINGYTDKNDIIEYFDGSEFYCSDNYYIRKILNINKKIKIEEKHLKEALIKFKFINNLINLESNDIEKELKIFNFVTALKKDNVTKYERPINHNEKNFLINFNRFDIILYEQLFNLNK